MSKRFLGVTVLSDFIQNEGVDGLLENLVRRAGVTAVACNPTVTAPADAATGSWQPPDDAGASVRQFDRPLWGSYALWVRSGPSFTPNAHWYAETPYAPRRPNDLTEREGSIVGRFVRAAKSAGLRVYFQVGAVQPPGLRTEDTPRLPNGQIPAARMAATGSLASPAIRAYNRAYARDLFRVYPELDGLRLDWPEYPCYQLDEAFQDFGTPVAAWAEAHGFDFDRIRQEVGELYQWLHGGLTNAMLDRFAASDPLAVLQESPAIREWLRLKAALSTDLLRDWREALTEAGGAQKELSANAFMPPFSTLTGLSFTGAAAHCGSLSPKLYTMHWALMVRFWGSTLLAANPGLDERLLVRTLVRLFDLADDLVPDYLAAFDYPQPDEPHPIPNGPQARKIDQALADTAGKAPVYALVHGYGPLEDFRRRLQLVADSRADGVWINRYGYLSDAKLDAIGEIWR